MHRVAPLRYLKQLSSLRKPLEFIAIHKGWK